MAKTADEFLNKEGWKIRIEGRNSISLSQPWSWFKDSPHHRLYIPYLCPHLEACQVVREALRWVWLRGGKKITEDEFVTNHAKFAACAHTKQEQGGGGNPEELTHAIIDVIASEKSHDWNVTLEKCHKVVLMKRKTDAFRMMDLSRPSLKLQTSCKTGQPVS